MFFLSSVFSHLSFILIILQPFVYLRTSELLCVIEFNRHGARTAKSFTSKTLSKVFGDQMILTPNGFRQHELLGQFIKNKYTTDINFLGKDYDKSKFEIYTTPIQRTINSAIAFINGFYPNSVVKMNYQDNSTLSGVINNDTIPFVSQSQLHYEEIPIEVFSKANDYFHRSDCMYKGEVLKDKIFKENENNIVFNITKMNLTEITVELSKFLNVEPPEDSDDIENGKYLSDLEKYLQTFLYHYGKNLDDPKLSKELANIIKMKMINKKYFYRIEDSKYLRILTSEIFMNILQKFDNSIYDANQRKMSVYFTHDTTLMNIFTNLLQNSKILEYLIKAIDDKDYFNFVFPPYASTLLFELYKRNDKYYVNINYNGKLIDKDFKYINDDKIVNGEIKYEDFKFMMMQLIEKDFKYLICDGVYVDKLSVEALRSSYGRKPKKDYTRHFLKKPRKK